MLHTLAFECPQFAFAFAVVFAGIFLLVCVLFYCVGRALCGKPLQRSRIPPSQGDFTRSNGLGRPKKSKKKTKKSKRYEKALSNDSAFDEDEDEFEVDLGIYASNPARGNGNAALGLERELEMGKLGGGEGTPRNLEHSTTVDLSEIKVEPEVEKEDGAATQGNFI